MESKVLNLCPNSDTINVKVGMQMPYFRKIVFAGRKEPADYGKVWIFRESYRQDIRYTQRKRIKEDYASG